MITKTLLQTKIHNLTIQRDSNMATIDQLAQQRQALVDETNVVQGAIVAHQELLADLEQAEQLAELDPPKLDLRPKLTKPDPAKEFEKVVSDKTKPRQSRSDPAARDKRKKR